MLISREENIWAIVLAAGMSTRMKRQKMLLPFRGKTIIESVISNIIPILNSRIIVVLGSHRYEISRQISNLPVELCENPGYRDGMLSSVIAGFRSLPGDALSALVFLGDQPHIPGNVTRKVMEEWVKTGKGIVIPVFNGKRGHPVLIETKYRKEIEKLDPSIGLRQLMSRFESDLAEIECGDPEILRDIDTPEDYKSEINSGNN